MSIKGEGYKMLSILMIIRKLFQNITLIMVIRFNAQALLQEYTK